MNKSEKVREYALAHVGCPYVYGGTAKPCTPSYRKARAEQYPGSANAIKKNCRVLSGKSSTCDGCKYNGKPAFDCAQLVKFAAAAAGISLPSGASSQWNKGEWEEKGTIDKMPRDRVCFVYKEKPDANPMGHTGVYLGDGTVADARGHAYGVMHKPIEDYPWTHYAIPVGMYDELPESNEENTTETSTAKTLPTLRKGDEGNAVADLQNLLLSLGYDLGTFGGEKNGVDGKFGNKTLAAVKQFQEYANVEVDGIVGACTWAALKAALTPDTPDAPAATLTMTVVIPNVDAATATMLLDTYKGAYCE